MAYAEDIGSWSSNAGTKELVKKHSRANYTDSSSRERKIFNVRPQATLRNKICIDSPGVLLLSRDTWLKKAHARIEKIEKVVDGWNGEGSIKPSRTSIYNTKLVVEFLYQVDLKPFNIVPSADDGVTLTFYNKNLSATIDCYNDGTIVVLCCEEDRLIKILTINENTSDLEIAVKKIDEFLR